MGAVVNSQRIINQILEVEEKGSESNMTDPFDELLEEMKKREGEKAKREGIQEGKLEGIQVTINTCKKFHITQEEALKNLIEEFALSEGKAKEYMDLYW